jgi:hypothetical protein
MASDEGKIPVMGYCETHGRFLGEWCNRCEHAGSNLIHEGRIKQAPVPPESAPLIIGPVNQTPSEPSPVRGERAPQDTRGGLRPGSGRKVGPAGRAAPVKVSLRGADLRAAEALREKRGCKTLGDLFAALVRETR